MEWTRQREPRRLVTARKPTRRHQTTVRWSDPELRQLQQIIPAGMKLADFIRRSALGSPLDGVDERDVHN